jgi:cobalt-zinc-cadmium efflux system outer membrane protein
LPAARSAYEAADEGYRQGKFGYLDILDAQRTLFEAKVRYVSSLTAYHQRRAAIERLIGRPVPKPHLRATTTTTPKPLSEEPSDEK